MIPKTCRRPIIASWSNGQPIRKLGDRRNRPDYHYDLSPRPVQKEVFLRQLDLARKTGKPFIIHEREAHADMLDIIRHAASGLNGVFHCFSGSVETAREYLKMGFYISRGRSGHLPKIGENQGSGEGRSPRPLVGGTDSPYLTPQPFRGKRNEPAHVRLVAEEIANLRDISRNWRQRPRPTCEDYSIFRDFIRYNLTGGKILCYNPLCPERGKS